LKNTIIASAKNNIAVFVRGLNSVNKKLIWNMKKHDARNANDSSIYFFDKKYITSGQGENINEYKILNKYSGFILEIC
jgi:hypothetical protein